MVVIVIYFRLRNCATLEYLSQTPAQHPQTFDLNIQQHTDHPFVRTITLLTSPNDESIILTCCKSLTMRNAEFILDILDIACHTIPLRVNTAVDLLGVRRFLFEAGDILFSLKTIKCPISTLPSTFPIILKMLSDVYQDKPYRVYLCSDSAIREVTDLKSDGFTYLKNLNLKILFRYLHIPFVSPMKRSVCHFLDIYEVNRLPNSSNYQVLVYPLTTDKCFPDSVYDTYINPEQPTSDDGAVFDQIALL